MAIPGHYDFLLLSWGLIQKPVQMCNLCTLEVSKNPNCCIFIKLKYEILKWCTASGFCKMSMEAKENIFLMFCSFPFWPVFPRILNSQNIILAFSVLFLTKENLGGFRLSLHAMYWVNQILCAIYSGSNFWQYGARPLAGVNQYHSTS